MGKAVAYLEESAADDLYASDGAILTWLLLAERFNLKSLMRRSANLAAIQYIQTRKDPRFSQLGVAALKAVMDNLHILAYVYPGVVSQTPISSRSMLWQASHTSYERVGELTRLQLLSYTCGSHTSARHAPAIKRKATKELALRFVLGMWDYGIGSCRIKHGSSRVTQT